MRHLFELVFVCALGVAPLVGCSETAGDGGSGGTGGSGGSVGSGGQGGTSCPALACLQVAETCESASVEPIEACCELPTPPAQVNACIGDESTSNPSSCGTTGVTTVYRLTSLELAADCNVGFNLDGCDAMRPIDTRARHPARLRIEPGRTVRQHRHLGGRT